jgi:hypothetical protein
MKRKNKIRKIAGHFKNDTEYLASIPGMKKKIVEGMKTPVSKMAKKLNW